MTEQAGLELLVVEDDETDRLAIRRYLRQSGVAAHADFATTGDEALKLVAGRQYDCVLLDYYIPGVEGPTLLDNIRRAVPGMPVVIFTGRGDEDVAVELMKSGVMDYFPKASLTAERLASGLRHATELARAAELQRGAEKQLRHQEARFRTLANSSPQLAWTCDASGARDWFNQRWFDYTGTTFAGAAGFGWQHSHHPDDLERVKQGLTRAFAAGESWEDTVRLRGANGEYRWFLSRAVPVLENENDIQGWIGTNTDITEVLEARTEAEAAVRGRDELIATVTHDLRNPLTVVAGHARRLQQELASGRPIDPAELSESAREIEASAMRMETLVLDLLETSLATMGEVALMCEPGDLARIAHRVVQTQQRINPAHGLRLSLKTDHVIGEWDIERMERVLTNLVSNAVKYSPGGGRVTVEVTVEGPEAVVRVSDEGVGIPAADIPHLFKRFERGSNVAGKIPGAGLGLASASDIVARHGGSISVESVEGAGSVFTVRVPLEPPLDPA